MPFETESDESPYNAAFVAKIIESDKNYADGKFEVIKIEDLWK